MIFAWIVLAAAVIMTVMFFALFIMVCGRYGNRSRGAEEGALFGGVEPEPLSAYAYDGTELRGVLLNTENAKGTVIAFHGHHSSRQKDFGRELGFLRGLGYNVLLCDERAHGESRGAITTLGIRERRDVCSWVTTAEQLFGEKHAVFLLGSDMGAAASLMAAGEELGKGVRGIIAESAYSDARDRLSALGNMAGMLAELGIQAFGRFRLAEKTAEDAVRKSEIPVLLIHGRDDALIPLERAEELFEACKGGKKLIVIDGAGHGECFAKGGETVENAIKAFIEANG